MEIKTASESEQELDFTRRPVPPSGRMPRFALTMAWWSVCSAMFWIVIAATLASIYGTKHALIGAKRLVMDPIMVELPRIDGIPRLDECRRIAGAHQAATGV